MSILRIAVRLALAGLAAITFAALAPGTASAAPQAAAVPAAPHVSYRVAFNPNNALSAGGLGAPTSVAQYDLQFGISDWRKENTAVGFRLHSRFYRDFGLSDMCLTGQGTSVGEATCSTNSSAGSQNWRLVPALGFVRLQHVRTGLFLTYPAGGSGDVFLAPEGSLLTQAFIERNEGVK